MKTNEITPFAYKQGVNQILKHLKKERDRQIIARRFGFGMAKKQTLEKIGRDFSITRERVRQIEKAAIKKLASSNSEEITAANRALLQYLDASGGIMLAHDLATQLGAGEPADQAYILFLATLAPDVELIEEDEQLRQALSNKQKLPRAKVRELSQRLVDVIKRAGKPISESQLAQQMSDYDPQTVHNIGKTTKQLASFEGKWGLNSWPQVNPRSIRDKTYVVLRKHKKPLHFSEIAQHISSLKVKQRPVTVQAVHNELIKDPRFILIGRGIYALAEWGYTPGTVADIIVDILKEEAPLHKDEIVRRVLAKRQVKTATIVLNLQEKEQFVRVAKATYKLQ